MVNAHKLQFLLAKILKEQREASALSQEALAFEAGLDRTTINRYENEKLNLSLYALFSVCEVLNVKPSKIIAQIEKDLY
jgi:transcriptional regulator with XRE-family HTH domain